MLTCPLHQLSGTEQEQEQPWHWDKCPHLVPHLPAVLGWSPVSQGQKDQGTCPVNPPALLGLWRAPCLGQRQQQASTLVLLREHPCLHPSGSHSHGGRQLVVPREQVCLEPMDQAPA